jgi:hypothetical protein
MFVFLHLSNWTASHHALIIGISMAIAQVVFVLIPFIVKSGVMPRRWRLWMLGEPRNSKPPQSDNIVI